MLSNLKSLPEYKRKQLAFVVALTATLAVFLFWLSSVGRMFSPPIEQVAVNDTGDPSPTAALIQSFSTFFGSVNDKVRELTQGIEVGL
jgi:hypothetical protein